MNKTRLALFALICILLVFSLAILYCFYKGQFYTGSDIFWYGAIAGFLACLLLVFLVSIIYLALKLRKK
jgi:uncharacterized membrane protein